MKLVVALISVPMRLLITALLLVALLGMTFSAALLSYQEWRLS
jgi:hypothetical protein